MRASIRSYSNSRTEGTWLLNLSTAMVDEIGSMRIVGCRFWTLHFSELETLLMLLTLLSVQVSLPVSFSVDHSQYSQQ